MSDSLTLAETAPARTAPRRPSGTRFLGLDFTPMSVDVAAALFHGEAANRPFSYIVTPNVDHMVRLERTPEFRPLYEDAAFLLNDSRVLELFARLDGKSLTPSPGSDIAAALFEQVIAPDEPVNIIGGSASDIEALTALYGLTDVRWHDAPMGLRKDRAARAAAVQFMADNPARVHFLCVGAPQQEMIAHEALLRGDVKGIGFCCGASIDFLTGKTARAPRWMQRARLEWLHRLASEPRRLAKRYLMDGPAILKIWWKYRRAQAA